MIRQTLEWIDQAGPWADAWMLGGLALMIVWCLCHRRR